MKKRQGSITATLVALLAFILLAATAYLGTAALAARKTAQGESFLQKGEYAYALDMFRAAEKYNKYTMRKDPRVTEGIAESCFGLEDYAAALEYYTLVVKTDPGNAEAAYRIGLICIKDNNYEKAEEQVTALERMGTYEAGQYAEALEQMIYENKIKGVFRDIYDRVAPNLQKIPGLSDGLDNLKEKLSPESGDAREDRERENLSPDAGGETEKTDIEPQTPDKTGTTI